VRDSVSACGFVFFSCVSVCLCMRACVSVARVCCGCHIWIYIYIYIHTYIYIYGCDMHVCQYCAGLSLSRSLSITHKHTHNFSLSIAFSRSLMYVNTMQGSRSRSLPLSHFLSFSRFLSLSLALSLSRRHWSSTLFRVQGFFLGFVLSLCLSLSCRVSLQPSACWDNNSLGFRVRGLGFRIQGLRFSFRVYRVYGLGFSTSRALGTIPVTPTRPQQHSLLPPLAGVLGEPLPTTASVCPSAQHKSGLGFRV